MVGWHARQKLLMRFHRFCVALTAAAIFLSAGARADTLTQTLSQTLTGLTGTEEDGGGIADFDPALGTLNSVTQTVAGTLIFTPTDTSKPASFVFGVNGNDTPIQSLLSETSGGTIDVSVTTGPTLEEFTGRFGQQYTLEPFDVEVLNGTLSSSGPVTDSFTFNYTPATTPEPSGLILLGTGVLGIAGATRRRLS